jgi:hypothetical protein
MRCKKAWEWRVEDVWWLCRKFPWLMSFISYVGVDIRERLGVEMEVVERMLKDILNRCRNYKERLNSEEVTKDLKDILGVFRFGEQLRLSRRYRITMTEEERNFLDEVVAVE